MRVQRRRIAVSLVIVYLGVHGVASAQQAGWTPQLAPPAASARGPSEPFRIRVAGVPPAVLERLALELDDIDVTSMVAMQGDVAVYTPAQPLAYGEHQLRLVEYGQDGSIDEHGQWTFEVRKSALFRDAQMRGNVTAKGVYRAADHGLTDPPDKTQADGAGQFTGSVADENWRANGMLTFIANSQTALMPRREGNVDLGQFMLAADSGLFGVKLGDHVVGPDSFVLQSFARRGISASATAPGNNASVTGFSMHTTPLTGAVHGLGITDSTNRVDGVVATVRPIPGEFDALALVGTYVSGESEPTTDLSAAPFSPSGAGVVGGTGAGGGRASSIIADSILLQRRLRLRGEYAASNYDFDGRYGDMTAQAGHAYSGLATYVPWSDMKVLDQPFTWNLGVEKKLLSSYFRSPSNPAAIADRDLVRAFTGVNWYGLDLQANVGRELDNVDDNPLIPRTASRQHGGTLTYSPPASFAPQANGQPPQQPWYGRASLNASFLSLDRELVQYNGSAYSLPTHATDNSVVGANFQYSTWNWGLMQTWVRDRGFDPVWDPTPFTRTIATRLQGSFRFFEKLNVGANAFHDHREDDTTGIRTEGVGGGLNLAYPLNDRIYGSVAYSVRHGWTTDGSDDSLTQDTTAAVNWVLLQPHEIVPGFTLGLDGSYHDAGQKSAVALAPGVAMYQVFLRLTMSWMPVY